MPQYSQSTILTFSISITQAKVYYFVPSNFYAPWGTIVSLALDRGVLRHESLEMVVVHASLTMGFKW